MDGGAWWAAVHGVVKSRTWLSDFTFTFHFHALKKAMATHSSVLAWKIPWMEEPGGLQSMGSHRVGHDWSDLAAAAASTQRGQVFTSRVSGWLIYEKCFNYWMLAKSLLPSTSSHQPPPPTLKEGERKQTQVPLLEAIRPQTLAITTKAFCNFLP